MASNRHVSGLMHSSSLVSPSRLHLEISAYEQISDVLLHCLRLAEVCRGCFECVLLFNVTAVIRGANRIWENLHIFFHNLQHHLAQLFFCLAFFSRRSDINYRNILPMSESNSKDDAGRQQSRKAALGLCVIAAVNSTFPLFTTGRLTAFVSHTFRH
jgi:hypothetical protein